MKSSFFDTLMKSVLNEKKSLNPSEIFRRIYKLPVKPISEQLIEKYKKEIKLYIDANLHFTTQEIEEIKNLWVRGLEYFSDNRFISIIENIEKIFYTDIPKYHTEATTEATTKATTNETKEDLNLNLLKSELNELMLYDFEDLNFLKLNYTQAVERIETSHKIRIDVASFFSSPGRFQAFLKSKDKYHFLKPKERKKIEILAESNNREFMELVDSIQYEYSQSEMNERKQNLKTYYEKQVSDQKEASERLDYLIKKIKDLEHEKR